MGMVVLADAQHWFCCRGCDFAHIESS
jgi:hypothetical protein